LVAGISTSALAQPWELFDGGKLLATGGVSQVEGADGSICTRNPAKPRLEGAMRHFYAIFRHGDTGRSIFQGRDFS